MESGAGNTLVPGVWKHLAFVHDGSKDIIYMDGVQVAEKNVTGTMNSTTKPLGIGYNAVDGGNFFDGALDEVQIYSTALSAAQIAALYATQNTAPTVLQGLVASYPFSNNALDATSFGNHGQATDVVSTTDRFGYGSSAYNFNGTSSEVEAYNSAQLNSDYTTISFWVKPRAFVVSGESYLLSFGGWQERFKISLPDHGKPVFTTHSGGACCSDMDSGTPLTLGTWTHVVMVHDGTKDIIYFNGAKVNEKNVAGALDATTKPLGIGFNSIDGGNWFDGALDEVQMYNYALSNAEVASLYTAQNTFPGATTDLVAEYKFAGNATDATQFSNHASGDAVLAKDRFGSGANAYQFDGTKSLVAANSVQLNSGYTTISFWVKPDEFPVSGEVYLLSNGGWQERWKISMPNHGKPVFTTHSGGACCSDMDSGTPLTLGTWTHVVMVHDGTKDIIYFNGAKVNEKNVAGTLDKTKHPLGIGYDPIDGGNFFKGGLDEVLVYNRALSGAEVAAMFAAQNAAPNFADDLVANYTFSGNADDSTPFNNNAKTTGAQLSNDRFGKANQAYAFNGASDKIEASNSPQQNASYTTISFWVNPTAFPVSGEVYLLSNGGWQERWKVSMPNHGKPVFTTHSNGACCSDLDSGTPLTIGAWTHVAMVHDGAKDIIYFNGVKVNEKNAPGTLDPTVKPLGIGFDPIDVNNYFNGSLDEVRIYKKALTDAEIAALYTTQATPPVVTDAEAPAAPLNLAASVTFNNVTLNWWPSSDNVGVTGYNLYQDGNKILTTANTSAYLPGLTPLTKFTFGVSAVDAAGNESLTSNLNVTTEEDEIPDTEAPTQPGNLIADAGAYSVLLSWDASTDNTVVKGYVASVDGIYFDSVTTTSVLVDGLDPETPYTFEVYAFDKAGNNSTIAELTVSTTKEIDAGEPGLVAYYPFEGNANDATPYANHGVIGGNPVFEAAVGHTNGGGQNIRFDGTGDSILAANAVQLISDFATVSFWIRVDSTNIADAEAYILDFGHWSQRWKISLPQHLKIVWTTNSNTPLFPSLIHDMDSKDGNDLVKGFWWYVTMVHDGTDDIIYVNGEEVNRLSAPGKLNTTGRSLGMGNNPIEGGQFFIGALDELKIYNKALIGSEVAKLYASGTTGTDDLSAELLRMMIQEVYPNPATERVWVKHEFDGKQPLQLRVFDVLGRQVDDVRFGKNEVPSDLLSLNVQHYPAGAYFLNFILGGKNLGSVKFNKR
jgi:chitodextrinase